MISDKEMSMIINHVELHLRNARGELNEVGRGLDMLRMAF